jgi:hypothetical protein
MGPVRKFRLSRQFPFDERTIRPAAAFQGVSFNFAIPAVLNELAAVAFAAD